MEAEKRKSILRDTGVTVAIITGVFTFITTWVQTHQASSDLKDSYSLQAHDLNVMNARLGRLEGKMDVIYGIPEKPKTKPSSVLDLGDMEIQGSKPAMGLLGGPGGGIAAPTADAGSTTIPENLDDALKMKRAKK